MEEIFQGFLRWKFCHNKFSWQLLSSSATTDKVGHWHVETFQISFCQIKNFIYHAMLNVKWCQSVNYKFWFVNFKCENWKLIVTTCPHWSSFFKAFLKSHYFDTIRNNVIWLEKRALHKSGLFSFVREFCVYASAHKKLSVSPCSGTIYDKYLVDMLEQATSPFSFTLSWNRFAE